MAVNLNIAQCLKEEAARQPRNRAVVFKSGYDPDGNPSYVHYTFEQLDKRSDFLAWGLRRQGIAAGMKVLLMIRPSLDFYALVFALFKLGAVPVMIDPGMGWTGFLNCVAQVAPEGFIGVPAAQLLRIFCSKPFATVKVNITLGKSGLLGGCPVCRLKGVEVPFEVYSPQPGETAAVLFTSGSTGPAKGVTYTHDIFNTQLNILRSEYGIGPGEMDLACFPLFSLFTVGLGACAVVPQIDPTHPAQANPLEIIEPIRNLGITYSFGSPTLWDRVSRYCVQHMIKLPGVKRIIMAGSPVPGRVHEALLNHVLDEGAETFTPYGATESLPVANFRGSEMLAETRAATDKGAGMCVGKPLEINQVRIIKITDEPIAEWDESLVLPTGEIGEICVKGPVVTREYYKRPDATALAKIQDGDAVWHRIGDVGYFDEKGRLWFCGRKAHRVETSTATLYSVRCEALFNVEPGVKRSALVGVGKAPNQTPVMVIEPEPDACKKVMADEKHFLDIASRNPMTASIKHVLFNPAFPVDVRHNAKINREQLAQWAEEMVKP